MSLILAVLITAATAGAAPKPAYKVMYRCSLDLREKPQSFVCLDGPQLLDRGRIVQLGRPIDRPDVLTLLDLSTFRTREVEVPGLRGKWPPSQTEPEVDRPMYYDTTDGMAGILLRTGGVRGSAEYAEWDLRANRISRRFPLATPDGAQWMSVDPVGYDPARKECYLQVVKYGVRFKTSPNRGGHYDVSVLAVSDRVRTVTSWTESNKLGSKGPYFDPVHRRSMHVEYSEHAGTISGAHLVDLETGAVKTYQLPPLIYGFAFDPDPRRAYAYSYRTREVFPLDLATGVMGKGRVFGNVGHLLDFVAPGVLCLGRNFGMHFLDAKTLKEKWFLNPKDFHKVDAHLEGSIFLPGRALVRSYENFYVIDFPGFTAAR
ncbi:MAG: hypothetical protein AAB152_15625 [Candidatus Coatesbacteria bacterium]